VYLYRAVDKAGRTVDFFLSRKPGAAGAAQGRLASWFLHGITCCGVRILFALLICGDQILVKATCSYRQIRRLPQLAETTHPRCISWLRDFLVSSVCFCRSSMSSPEPSSNNTISTSTRARTAVSSVHPKMLWPVRLRDCGSIQPQTSAGFLAAMLPGNGSEKSIMS
jgi:hypothetical protein